MLRKIKFNLNKTGLELAEFLKVSEATIYNWEKRDNWPLWALKKCGIINEY